VVISNHERRLQKSGSRKTAVTRLGGDCALRLERPAVALDKVATFYISCDV